MAMITVKIRKRGFILLEVIAAAAIIAVAALSLSAALITASQITAAAKAVTRGRLLAQSHLEMARAGVAPEILEESDLISTLILVEDHLFHIEVQGTNLQKPLTMVGGP